MPAATCTPGQQKTAAIAPFVVVLQPSTDDFGNDSGDVYLVSNKNNEDAEMPCAVWHRSFVEAKLPDHNPGTGAEDETFTIKVKRADETIFEAGGVRVRGSKSNGWYPPMHDPTAVANLVLS